MPEAERGALYPSASETYGRALEISARKPYAAESFYLLVWPPKIRPVVRVIPRWPEACPASLMATAPVSSLDAVVRILESYAALLTKQGRVRDAGLIEHGVARVKEGLLDEARPRRP